MQLLTSNSNIKYIKHLTYCMNTSSSFLNNPQSHLNGFRTNLAYFNPRTLTKDTLNRVETSSFALDGFLSQSPSKFDIYRPRIATYTDELYASETLQPNIKSLLIPENQQSHQFRTQLRELIYIKLCEQISELLHRYSYQATGTDYLQDKFNDIMDFLIVFQANIEPKIKSTAKKNYDSSKDGQLIYSPDGPIDLLKSNNLLQESDKVPRLLDIEKLKDKLQFMSNDNPEEFSKYLSQSKSSQKAEAQNSAIPNSDPFHHLELKNDEYKTLNLKNLQNNNDPSYPSSYNTHRSHNVQEIQNLSSNFYKPTIIPDDYDEFNQSNSCIVHSNKDAGPNWSINNESPVKQEDTPFGSQSSGNEFKNKAQSLNDEIRGLIDSQKQVANQNYLQQLYPEKSNKS